MKAMRKSSASVPTKVLECTRAIAPHTLVSYAQVTHITLACSIYYSKTNAQTHYVCDAIHGGQNEEEGRVEACFEGHWFPVYHEGWSEREAKVVCQQLQLLSPSSRNVYTAN